MIIIKNKKWYDQCLAMEIINKNMPNVRNLNRYGTLWLFDLLFYFFL